MRLDIRSLDKRKLTRIVAVVAVALAAGHLVQTIAARKGVTPAPAAALSDAAKPVEVVQLAATNDPVPDPTPPQPVLPPIAMGVLPAPVLVPEPAPLPMEKVEADPCAVTFDLMVDAGAMLGLTLLAPCHPAERVVLRHAGLAVTAMTTANGALFLTLPALESAARVQVNFADGIKAEAALAVPELVALRRFGVQWQGEDAFQLFSYEGGTTVSASNAGMAPIGSAEVAGGFLTVLGDVAAPNPLLAQIYTFPALGSADVVVEAAVTPATCGREILGETLASVAGSVTVTELTLAMPECDAAGGFLVLKNLVPDLTLAAAN